jgi:hypothetical protein
MLGEVAGGDEGKDMRLEALDLWVVEQLDGRIVDGAVHAFGLAVGQRPLPKRDDQGFPTSISTVLRRSRGCTGASAVPKHGRHFAIVVRLSP